MRCSLCISYVGKTTFSILRHIHYCIHGHYTQWKTFVKSHLLKTFIYVFDISGKPKFHFKNFFSTYFNLHQEMLGKQQLYLRCSSWRWQQKQQRKLGLLKTARSLKISWNCLSTWMRLHQFFCPIVFCWWPWSRIYEL